MTEPTIQPASEGNELSGVVESTQTSEQPIQDSGNVDGQSTENESIPTTEQSQVEDSGSVTEESPKSPEDVLRDYKALEADYTKKNQEYKANFDRINALGGLDAIENIINNIASNPEVVQQLMQGQSPQPEDNPYEEADSEAIDTVKQIATDIAKQMVAPYEERIRQQDFEVIQGKMDANFPDWKEYQSEMVEISRNLPTEVTESPSYEVAAGLYAQAVIMKDGGLTKLGEKAYKQSLEVKKKQSSTPTSPAPPTNTGAVANSIQEAAEQAKRELGL